MNRCQHCQSAMTVSRLECTACGLGVEGRFATPRLARLTAEDQHLIESFVLCGGSLKTLAEQLSITYPTVRKRVDAVIERVQMLQSADERQTEAWLKSVEGGEMSPEMASRLIREQAYG